MILNKNINTLDVLLEKLKKLDLPLGKYAIAGSTIMSIRGWRECKDIDIIVKKDLWDFLVKKYSSYQIKDNLIRYGKIEIWKDWMVFTNKIDEMIDSCDFIRSFPCIKLKYLIMWKKYMNRDKDLKDLSFIKEKLRNQK